MNTRHRTGLFRPQLVAAVLSLAACGSTGGSPVSLDSGAHPDGSATEDLSAAPPADMVLLPDLTAGCQSGLLDGDETDTDCGGPRCGACADGKRCLISADCSGGRCTEGVCGPVQALTLNLSAQKAFGAAKYWRMVAGDVNGDGLVDLVTTDNSMVAAGATFLGAGDGTFGAAVPFTVATANTPVDLVTGDFNRDGRLDLALAGRCPGSATGGVTLALGDGRGGFAAGPCRATPHEPTGLAAGDLDGDGALDVVAPDYSLAIFRGMGDGTLNAAKDYPLVLNNASENTWNVRLGDFNGDRKLDVAVTTNRFDLMTAGSLVVLLNDGAGGVAPPLARYQLSGFNARDLTLGDWNGDRKLDFAAIVSNAVVVATGTGTGAFNPFTLASDPYAEALWSTDLDLDGIPDLAITNSNDSAVAAWRGNGKGVFLAAQRVSPFLFAPDSLVTADFNRDGKPDLATASSQFTGIVVVLNTSK